MEAKIKSRGILRTKVSRICTKNEGSLGTLNLTERTLLLSNLENMRAELNSANDSIHMDPTFDDATLEDHLDKEEEYDQRLGILIVQLQQRNKAVVPDQSSQSSSSGSTGPQSSGVGAKLPYIKLPTFGNKPNENYRCFIRSFEAAMKNRGVSTEAQFMFLESQLSGGALAIIRSIDVDERTYQKARDLLDAAFDDPQIAKHNAIKKLAELKLKAGVDPYIYIGDLKSISSTFNTLQLDVKDVLQYFFWNSLDSSFQGHLTAITNKSRPSLDEIEANLFEACNRYLNDISKPKKIENTEKIASTTMAANVQHSVPKSHANKSPKGKNFCALCMKDKRDSDHPIYRCSVYPTPKSKLDKLRQLEGCTVCSFISHKTNSCNFVFKSPCKHCSRNHMSYLCPKATDSGHKANTSRSQSQQAPVSGANMVPTVGAHSVVDVSFSSAGDSIVLPTFTADINGSSGKAEVRLFKDGGCMRSFIERKLVQELGLKIIEPHVVVTINGFNETRSITTQVVQVPLTLGTRNATIQAIVIDEIKTGFKVSNMHLVVDNFVSKGYEIADRWLLNNFEGSITDIGIILGTEDDHILPICPKLFGSPIESCYYETDIGVIFSGNVSRMVENLPHLSWRVPATSFSAVATCQPPSIRKSPESSNKPEHKFQDQCSYEAQNILEEIKKLDQNLEKTLEIVHISETENNVNECDKNLIEHVLANITRDSDGRLVTPLAWNPKNCHLLSKNFNLCKQILASTLNKLSKDRAKLEMYNQVFEDQVEMGIIEKFENVEEFVNNNQNLSFMPHMGIFKMERESTKCRVVFLSNLCERKNGNGLCLNQCMTSGPLLNVKMGTAVMQQRFSKYLLTFDLKKAFLMLALKEADKNKLAFLWYKDVKNGDFSLVAYRSLRLPFGLVCSPFVLMINLYKICILDQVEGSRVSELMRTVYGNFYMDNGSYNTDNSDNLAYAYEALPKVFGQYQFGLQQFYCNDTYLQSIIDKNENIETPNEVKLFGLTWHRMQDEISPPKLTLDESCNTKRKILASLNAVYDIFHIYAPLILRAKLFMQRLQLDADIQWDTELPEALQREWTNISRQANSTPPIRLPRCVGSKDSKFDLICCTDSSAEALGCVTYIKDNNSNAVSFLMARNKVLSVDLKKKTMPTLELLGIEFGVETMMDLYLSLAGEAVVDPINISSLHIFSDNTACLHWLESFAVKFSKMQKLTTFVNNRLNKIEELCKIKTVQFRHIAGELNPADCCSRPYSYRVLSKTRYFEGPEFLDKPLYETSLDSVITIPNPILRRDDDGDYSHTDHTAEVAGVNQVMAATLEGASAGAEPRSVNGEHPAPDVAHSEPQQLVPLDRYGSLHRLVSVHRWVLKAVDKFKRLISSRSNSDKIKIGSSDNYYKLAYCNIIRVEQQINYPEIFAYFESKSKGKRDIPELVSKLNLYLNNDGILCIKSKIPDSISNNSILIPKHSSLTEKIIRNIHEKLSHSGIYPILRKLREEFYVEHYFSSVKKVLKNCITCRRFNEPPIKLNQNCYRDFRISPNEKPYSSISIDFAGPFTVKLQGKNVKIWILLVTCLFTRAINLVICRSMDTNEFLRALQLHVFQHGAFQFCLSDLGSQIKAGAKIVSEFLDDDETRKYFESNGMKTIQFHQYSKGNSALGSTIEVCVDMTKKLLFKSIRKVILDYFDFEFILVKTVDLLNKRPIAFKESLRDLPFDQIPFAITPELLLKGYETCTLNIIPNLQHKDYDCNDPTFDPGSSDICDSFGKLSKVKENLLEVYHSEFLATLINQAIDKRDRYKPVLHKKLKPGDIVLLVDKFAKRYHYKMARVDRVEENSNSEVTAAYVFKGSTNECVYRHVTSLILLISHDGFPTTNKDYLCGENVSSGDHSNAVTNPCIGAADSVRRKRPRRLAAETCKKKLKRQAAEV